MKIINKIVIVLIALVVFALFVRILVGNFKIDFDFSEPTDVLKLKNAGSTAPFLNNTPPTPK
jgi:hypothetical protein